MERKELIKFRGQMVTIIGRLLAGAANGDFDLAIELRHFQSTLLLMNMYSQWLEEGEELAV